MFEGTFRSVTQLPQLILTAAPLPRGAAPALSGFPLLEVVGSVNRTRQLLPRVVFQQPCNTIPSANPALLRSLFQEFEDVPKTARHVSISWLEASASASKIQQTECHAVRLAPDYCSCLCRHR